MAKEPERAPPQVDPAEGSRDTIDRELERKSDEKQKKPTPSDRDQGSSAKT
ncbi:hypothetical protein GCM10007276_23390 [Agaricicola taiwanensis]|uniref:Uncharacterized protein n=1 Tax=Agaricicola taiwanensis TaxID=591372 RepID=A0A8J2YIX1_9RHOB|nr:hypothetical protein [Agaricicola taiwanensis]GGE45499.1 hypothetical protein GCM10007276_23390 [Agaricicola taiwanensis]